MEFTGTQAYLTNPALEAAVRCALVLEKPLLVRGAVPVVEQVGIDELIRVTRSLAVLAVALAMSAQPVEPSAEDCHWNS